MSLLIYVVSIDIKDGWYDVIHAYSNRQAAESYVAWQANHSGDHCYIVEVALDDTWSPPKKDAPASLLE